MVGGWVGVVVGSRSAEDQNASLRTKLAAFTTRIEHMKDLHHLHQNKFAAFSGKLCVCVREKEEERERERERECV
jgi:hypothetical protein